MGRKKKGLLAGIRQHNDSTLANLLRTRPPQLPMPKLLTADLMMDTMAKALASMPKPTGPVVIVAGAGIMPLSEAVAKFGDCLVHVNSVDELLGNHAKRPFSTFEDLAVCDYCGARSGAHTTVTSPEGATMNCPTAESIVLAGKLGEGFGADVAELRRRALGEVNYDIPKPMGTPPAGQVSIFDPKPIEMLTVEEVLTKYGKDDE